MKRVFICCNGTWQNASGTVSMTNVAKLAQAVDRFGNENYRNPELDETGTRAVPYPSKGRHGFVREMVYYSRGVGSQSSLLLDSK
jgi:uncharacterized protein (DUF2235 family)